MQDNDHLTYILYEIYDVYHAHEYRYDSDDRLSFFFQYYLNFSLTQKLDFLSNLFAFYQK